MILTVEHMTRYTYDRPVRGLVQSHRLTPASSSSQTVEDWTVEVTDGIRGGAFRDGAGDLVQSWSVMGPVSEVEVAVRGRVETRDLHGVLRGHRELVPPQCYLQDTLPTRLDLQLTEIAAEVNDHTDALDAAHRLSDLIAEAIAYMPGSTQSQTTASEAMTQGQGVCQDQAHALLAVARGAGMPARYVSGYLLGSGGMADATHAWAEIWIGGLGWTGFDVANRCCPDERYIRLSSGLDAQDAAPIRGIARSTGSETLAVSVAVHAVQQ